MPGPSAIVIGDPAPWFVGDPGPAISSVPSPVSETIGRPVGGDSDWRPGPSIFRSLDPVSILIKIASARKDVWNVPAAIFISDSVKVVITPGIPAIPFVFIIRKFDDGKFVIIGLDSNSSSFPDRNSADLGLVDFCFTSPDDQFSRPIRRNVYSIYPSFEQCNCRYWGINLKLEWLKLEWFFVVDLLKVDNLKLASIESFDPKSCRSNRECELKLTNAEPGKSQVTFCCDSDQIAASQFEFNSSTRA
jgi:hypothetical protein